MEISVVEQILIEEISIPPGQRGFGNLDELITSIQTLGLLQPILVIRKPPQYQLVAGWRRYNACKHLDWSEIPAIILEVDELHAVLATIDENLIRQELSVLEHAEQLVRRKEIYEALHPETRHGHGPGRGHHEKRRNKFASFADDTSLKTGRTPRTIQQEVRIAKKLSPRAKESIRPLPIADKKNELLRLAQLPPETQEAIADQLASGSAKSALKAQRALKAGAAAPDSTPARRRGPQRQPLDPRPPECSSTEEIGTPPCTPSSSDSNSHRPSLKGGSLDGRRRTSWPNGLGLCPGRNSCCLQVS